jgi:hypothetical protein
MDSNVLQFMLTNNYSKRLSDLLILINKNALGITFASNSLLPAYVEPNKFCIINIPILFFIQKCESISTNILDVEIKINVSNYFETISVFPSPFYLVKGKISQVEFVKT